MAAFLANSIPAYAAEIQGEIDDYITLLEVIFGGYNGLELYRGDLVVMDIETYNRREKMLKLREELLAVEEDRMHGSKGYSVGEVAAMMRSAIKEAAGHGKTE